MDAILTYYHNSNKIGISFSLNSVEESFAIGFGKTCDEARNNLRGWFDNKSELSEKTHPCEEGKPFIALMKKRKDGQIIKLDPCIDILKDFPRGASNQVTVREICF